MPKTAHPPWAQQLLTIVKTYCVPILFLASVQLVLGGRVSDLRLFADPTELANKAPYVGLFSRFGNLLWCATAAVCLFCALVTRQLRDASKQYSRFLGWTGIFLTVLLLDDYFELHEYFAIALSGAEDMLDDSVRGARDRYEGLVMVGYAIALSVYAVKFRRFILKGNLWVLGSAIALLAFSAVVDLAHPQFEGAILLEDGAKFIGIWGILIYFIQYCRSIFETMLTPIRKPPVEI